MKESVKKFLEAIAVKSTFHEKAKSITEPDDLLDLAKEIKDLEENELELFDISDLQEGIRQTSTEDEKGKEFLKKEIKDEEENELELFDISDLQEGIRQTLTEDEEEEEYLKNTSKFARKMSELGDPAFQQPIQTIPPYRESLDFLSQNIKDWALKEN